MGEALGTMPGIRMSSGTVGHHFGATGLSVLLTVRSFIHSFFLSLTHSFSKQFWSTCYEPGLLWELGVQTGQVTPGLGNIEGRAW